MASSSAAATASWADTSNCRPSPSASLARRPSRAPRRRRRSRLPAGSGRRTPRQVRRPDTHRATAGRQRPEWSGRRRRGPSHGPSWPNGVIETRISAGELASSACRPMTSASGVVQDSSRTSASETRSRNAWRSASSSKSRPIERLLRLTNHANALTGSPILGGDDRAVRLERIAAARDHAQHVSPEIRQQPARVGAVRSGRIDDLDVGAGSGSGRLARTLGVRWHRHPGARTCPSRS